MICPRYFLRMADSDIIVSLHLVIPFISMGSTEKVNRIFLKALKLSYKDIIIVLSVLYC
jgi:hypothetical protein